jgi:rod shape-determining protein MreD
VNQVVWTRLDGAARSLAPVTFTVLLIVIGMVPLGVPNFAPIMPALGVIAVFFWLVYRPDLMPAWAVFLVGLIQDLLGGGALGVGVFVLLVVYAALVGQRRQPRRRRQGPGRDHQPGPGGPGRRNWPAFLAGALGHRY